MTPNERAQVESVFDTALELPPARREDWLEQQFAEQPGLLAEVRRLLKAEADSHDLFESLAAQRTIVLQEALPSGNLDLPDPRIGSSYGPWRVIRHIGTGGLAEVYEVQRADGRFDQKGALKILRAGILGDHARALFLRERQLLAKLDAPGVVRIIDGGETRTGAPWLVMELAEGVPIGTYCAEHALAVEARLGLLAKAADIFQAAHARRIIHGDIKSEHVLVDLEGRPRVLDFGIAQALDEHGLGRSAEGFSPLLASPEQQRGDDLTTASDIFQFGRLIELAFGPDERRGAIAAIMAKALHPDPAGRYASMAGLAADLRAVAEDQPISAQPDTATQSLWRLVRHNRAATALTVLVIAGSAGWAITATLASTRIEQQRSLAQLAADREKRGKDMLIQLFRRADILEADSLGLEPDAAAAMLDDVLATARKSISDDPVLLADLLNWTARAHLRAGNQDRAISLAQEELRLVQASNQKGTLREGSAHGFLANALARSGDQDGAKRHGRLALSFLTAGTSNDPRALDLLISVAWSHEGDWVRQKELFVRAEAISSGTAGPGALIEIHSGLGRALAGLGELEDGRRHIQTAITLVRKSYGDHHPRMALPLSELGRLEEKAGNPEAAIRSHRAALAISVRAFGDAHPSSLAHRNNLALALLSADRGAEAVSELEALLAVSPDGLSRGEVAQNLGAALVQQKRWQRAEAVLGIAEVTFAKALPADHPRQAFPALSRAEMWLALRRFDRAEADARKAFTHLGKALPPGHFATETARCRVGMALLGQGKRKAARPYILTALTQLEKAGSRVPARLIEPCRNAARQL